MFMFYISLYNCFNLFGPFHSLTGDNTNLPSNNISKIVKVNVSLTSICF